ncbi:MAG: hypothetical protein QOI95_4250 [Acidimicrobiaceae bacterium]|jgi:hypothetical protein
MEDSKWARYAALGGFVFVVLNVVAGFLPGVPPASDDSATEVAKYFKDNATNIQTAQALALLGTIGLAWWFGSLFRRMRAAEGGDPRLSVVALLGLALGGATAIMSGAITAATAMRIDDFGTGGEGAVRLFYSLSLVVIASSAAGVIIFLSAFGALNYRARMFPAWTSYLAWLAAAGFLVGLFSVCTDASAINSIGFISFLVWCVWIVAISWLMWREASPTS